LPRYPPRILKSGIEIKNYNQRLEKDTTDRDKYNRLLRYVYADETLINLELVKLGFAQAWAYPPDLKYQDQINAAQQTAKKLKTGLWTACP
jgi:micrococcal nuclease